MQPNISSSGSKLVFQSAAPPRSWPFLKVGQFWQTNLSGWRTSRKTKASKAASVGGLFHFPITKETAPARGRAGAVLIERSAGARRRVSASNGVFAAGFPCLIPAAPAVPAAAGKQQNDKYDDEKRGVIHVELLLAVPCVFSHFAYALPLQPTPLIPIRSYLRRHDTPNRPNQRLYPAGPVVRSILTLFAWRHFQLAPTPVLRGGGGVGGVSAPVY